MFSTQRPNNIEQTNAYGYSDCSDISPMEALGFPAYFSLGEESF